MKNFLIVITFLFYLINCKKEAIVSNDSNLQNAKIDFKTIAADVSITDGTILLDLNENFEVLEKFNVKALLEDFNYFGKNRSPLIRINGIDNNAIARNTFNESTIWFQFDITDNNIEYDIQTHSVFDTAGSNSDGIIKEVKCSSYTDILIKCKFYFATTNPENGMPPISWVIVTIKDRALVNVQDNLGASFLGYIDTDKQYPEKYISNLKKALKVAVKDPEIGLKDVQLQGFSIEELDLLTDGLASQVKNKGK